MKRTLTFLILGFATLTTTVAHAAADTDPGPSASSGSTLLAYLPIAGFLLVLVLLFRYQLKSPAAQLHRQYLQRQIEHTQRVEQLLERIASSLENGRRDV